MKEKKRMDLKYKILMIVFASLVIACIVYVCNFNKCYEEAKILSEKGEYSNAYFKINNFPLVIGNEEVKQNVKIIEVKKNLGEYKESAKSSFKYMKNEFIDVETKKDYFYRGVYKLYQGLENCLKFEATNEQEKSIKNDFIMFYYYNLYLNISRSSLEEKYMNKVFNMNYDEFVADFSDKIIILLEDYNKFHIEEAPKSFESILFDNNMKFHFPKIKYKDKNNKIIKSDYLINTYR